MTRYEKAFLDTIAWAEGTLGVSNNGYDVLVNDNASKGARIMVGWTKDTKIIHGIEEPWKVKVGSVFSSAAGRYQFIGTTWVELNDKINAPMTKDNQDAAGLKLARRKLGSNFDFKIDSIAEMEDAAKKIKDTWSSFRSGTNTPKELYDIYVLALGKY